MRSGRSTRRAVTFDNDDAESEEEDQEELIEEKPAKTRRTRKTSKEDSPSEVVEEKPKTGRRVKKPSKEDDPKPVEKKAAVKKTTRKAKVEEAIEKVEDEKPKRTRKTKVVEVEVNIFISRMHNSCKAYFELPTNLSFRNPNSSRHKKDQLVGDKRLVISWIVLQRKQHEASPKNKMPLRRPRRKSQKLARQHHRKKKRQSQHDLGLKRRL